MAIDPENGIAQITARLGMARLGTARLGAVGKRWELRDGDPFSESMEICRFEDCVGSVTGQITEGVGFGGLNGFAMLCGDSGSLSANADGAGLFEFTDVPCGDYTLTIWDSTDQAYRDGYALTVNEGVEEAVGGLALNTLGAHPSCP